MYGRAGLDRFKKAQSLEPFSVTKSGTQLSLAHPPQFQLIMPEYHVLNKVKKSPAKSIGIYDDLYGNSFSVNEGSWAYASAGSGGQEVSVSKSGGNASVFEIVKSGSNLASDGDEDDDDLFG